VECDPARYAEPTIATSLKEQSKHQVPVKPSRRPQIVVQAVESRSRLACCAHDRHHDFPKARRSSSDRKCMSDDDADDERCRRRSAGRLRHSPGRLSYSDDELTVYQSPRRYLSRGTQCSRQFISHNTESAATPSDDVRLHQQVASSARPTRRGCYACGSAAMSR